MKLYTKENLITEFHKIAQMGWIENARHGNSGGIGNTLEDLLGIEEFFVVNKSFPFRFVLSKIWDIGIYVIFFKVF